MKKKGICSTPLFLPVIFDYFLLPFTDDAAPLLLGSAEEKMRFSLIAHMIDNLFIGIPLLFGVI